MDGKRGRATNSQRWTSCESLVEEAVQGRVWCRCEVRRTLTAVASGQWFRRWVGSAASA